MAFKFLALAVLVAVAQAGVLPAAPIAYSGYPHAAAYAAKAVVPEPFDPNPQYQYGYGINDHLTGDSKDAQEVRNGDAVHGSYSLIDADGYKRTVEYTADDIHGFNAVVHREPLGVKAVAPVVAKVAAPVAYGAPVYHH